jgi:hypothetical protein
MDRKKWLKEELEKEQTGGNIRAIFNTSISLLDVRIKWLKRTAAPAADVVELVRDDIKIWRDELHLTDDDEC